MRRDRMVRMQRRPLFRFAVVLVTLGLAIGLISVQGQNSSKRGRKYKAPAPTARVEITILRDTDGRPIENAAVIFHPIVGGKDQGNMELKTNEDGKSIIDVLPIGGTVRLQIIAKGFKTYGQDYDVDKPEFAIEVRMKRPGEQYSVYKPHDQAPDKPADKDKPAEDSKKPDAQPSQPQ
jgi:hypothetical protein